MSVTEAGNIGVEAGRAHDVLWNEHKTQNQKNER